MGKAMSSVASSSAQNHAHCCRMYTQCTVRYCTDRPQSTNLFTSVQQHTGQGASAMVKEGRKEKEKGEREGKDIQEKERERERRGGEMREIR
jgi:hypothetical protein